jgi:glycerol-3-phosphate dehydrogenase (NAD(P)+)
MRCGVVGAGAWGTALADLLARTGYEVRLWAHEAHVADVINGTHENTRFLAGHALDRSLEAFTELRDVVADSTVVLFAPPSFAMRELARQSQAYLSADALIVVATKGIEPDSHALMSQVVEQETGARRIVALSGPSFAAEVAGRQPTAVVVASEREEDSGAVQRLFASDTFRTYTHTDVTGVELGGALKNVMAVATGIAEGLGLGNNARAALITRGLAEMTRLGVACGARASTFAGLAGIGDLVLTCTGALSRNRSVGVEIGRGRTLSEALAGRETVAEGVITTRSARALAAKLDVEMPIVESVHSLLFDGVPPRDAIAALMARELRAEED